MESFLKKLADQDLSLSIEEGQLVLRGIKDQPKQGITKDIGVSPDVIKYIKDNKQMLLNYLEPSPEPSISTLSPLQEGILFHGLYNESSDIYVEQLLCDFNEGLDVDIFQKAWSTIMETHNILRASFISDKLNLPVMSITHSVKLPISVINVEEVAPNNRDGFVANFIKEDKMKGFIFDKPPLMRITLFKTDIKSYKMLWTSHHILLDGWSIPILVAEFLKIYGTLKDNKIFEKPQVDDYQDFIRLIEGRDKFDEEDFWKSYLRNFETPSLLPFVKKFANSDRNKIGDYKDVVYNSDILFANRLKGFAATNGITVNTLLQGVWSYLLSQYSGKDDVVYGTVVSGRPTEMENAENRVGLYINTLPLRSQLDGSVSLLDWLKELQVQQTQARNFQYNSLNEVQKWSKVKGEFFNTILVFENYPMEKAVLDDTPLAISSIEMKTTKNNYPFSIVASLNDQLKVRFTYNSELIEESYIEVIRDQFVGVIQQIVSPTTKKFSDIRIKPPESWVQIQQAPIKYEHANSIIDVFNSVALEQPKEVALQYKNDGYSYEWLNNKTNDLAIRLRNEGVTKNDFVGVSSTSPLEMIVGLFGIMKAGGAYVPIDPDFPLSRIEFIIKDVDCGFLVTNETIFRDKLNLPHIKLIPTLLEERESDEEILPDFVDRNPKDLAYVIYTSGSTGKPKGVPINHGNLLDYLEGIINRLNIGSYHSFGLMSGLFTDLGNTLLYGSILNGSTLFLFSKSQLLDAEYLQAYFKKNVVECIKIVPSLWKMVANFSNDSFPKNMVIFGGEELSPSIVREIFDYRTDLRIINHYGPTETTIGKLVYEVLNTTEYEKIPIGRPFSANTVYIEDANSQPVGIGIIGQIVIAGQGVSEGYLDKEDTTLKHFDTIKTELGTTKLYRTGDLGRFKPDGNIEFLGRMDDQIKLNGNRIELEEIKEIILKSQLVKDAVVLLHENLGLERIIAFIIPELSFSKTKLLDFLGVHLPDYMIPKEIQEVSKFPLTSSGKLAKTELLQAMSEKSISTQIMDTANEVEQTISKIWERLLKTDEINKDTNFFEIGGNSLLAIRMISMIRKSFDSKISITDLFNKPTVRELAEMVSEQSATNTDIKNLINVTRPERLPLSHSQERLWFIDRLQGSVPYHIPIVLRFKRDVDKEHLEESIREVVNRHEVLRTVYLEENGIGYQKILPKNQWNFSPTDLVYNGNESTLDTSSIQDVIDRPFTLSKDHMIRATFFESDVPVLVIVLHHIACDGWSIPILVKEVIHLYEQKIRKDSFVLQPLKVQYADYAVHQKKELTDSVLKEKLDFWKSRLKDATSLDFPIDFVRPPIQSYQGSQVPFKIDNATHEKFRRVLEENKTTSFIGYLAVFILLLRKYSSQQDISVGTPVANRDNSEVQGLIGFFVNTLVIRTKAPNDISFKDFLNYVRKEVIQVLESQDVPFEKIVDSVQNQRDLSKSPLFQCLFVYKNKQDMEISNVENPTIESVPIERTTTQFELSFSLKEEKSGLSGTFEFCVDIYKKETIDRAIRSYNHLLEQVIRSQTQPLSTIEIVDLSERKKIVEEFNGTEVTFSGKTTLVDLFRAQVDLTPNHVAVTYEDTSYTYDELEKRSNQLAHYLRDQGVEPGMIVAVLMDRSLDMAVSLLAILSAGAAYVPIDPEYPEDRINFILEDTGTKYVLSKLNHMPVLMNCKNVRQVLVDIELPNIENQPLTPINPEITENSKAYVIYTSGSTGKPKGVVNLHAGIVNRLLWAQAYFKLTKTDKVLQKTTYCFDVSVWEIFWPLIAGSSVVFADQKKYKDAEYLTEIIKSNGITTLHFVPSMLEVFLLGVNRGSLESLKRVLSSGEALKPEHVESFQNRLPHVRLYNLYGPTEAAIDVTVYPIESKHDKKMKIPIGKPISNTKLYILDENKNMVGIGVPGELYIGGIQVAEGYLNRPHLNDKKFVDGQFIGFEGKIYATGDRARWLPDGNIEYLGRFDQQVKIRGNRIELGEIEHVIGQYEHVKHSVAIIKENAVGDNVLAVAVVANEGYVKKEMLDFIKKKLPEYMIPSISFEIDKLPLTPNGKVDRKEIYRLSQDQISSQEYVVPRTSIEKSLVSLWKEQLSISRIGVKDNFFELGGHSLSVIRLKIGIQKKLDVVVPVPFLYQHPTVEEQAKFIEEHAHGNGRIELLRELTKDSNTGYKACMIAIPYLAGDGIAFKNLAQELDNLESGIGLYALSLPRDSEHYSNISEQTFDSLTTEILNEVESKIDKPLIIWGHCGGSFLASYLAKRIEQANTAEVIAFCSGGSLPPHLRTDPFKKDPEMTDKKVRELLSYAGIDKTNPDFKEDDWLWVVQQYKYDIAIQQISFYFLSSKFDKRDIRAETFLVFSKDDPLTSGYDKESFIKNFKKASQVRLLELESGGHYFIESRPTEVAEFVQHIVVEKLSKRMESYN